MGTQGWGRKDTQWHISLIINNSSVLPRRAREKLLTIPDRVLLPDTVSRSSQELVPRLSFSDRTNADINIQNVQCRQVVYV